MTKDPLVLFGWSDKENPKIFKSRYWDYEDNYNPRLRIEVRPFAKFWAISSEIFGYPWADPSTTTITEELADLMTQQNDRKRVREGISNTVDGRKKAPVDPRSPARVFSRIPPSRRCKTIPLFLQAPWRLAQ